MFPGIGRYPYSGPELARFGVQASAELRVQALACKDLCERQPKGYSEPELRTGLGFRGLVVTALIMIQARNHLNTFHSECCMTFKITRGIVVFIFVIVAGFALIPASLTASAVTQPRQAEASQKDPLSELKPEDIASGERIFVGHCAYCHGIGATGERGPNLARAVLRHAPDNQALFKVIQGGIDGSEMPAAWQLSDHEVWQVAGYIRSLGRTKAASLPGDSQKGRSIYGKEGCAACHVVHGAGGVMGPDLSDVGLRRSPAYIREALTEPGKSVPDGFLMVRIDASNGKSVEGIRLNEDTFTIQVRDLSGRIHSFRKSETAKIDKEFGKSPMPSYAKSLNASDLDDIVAYLAGLRGEQ